jgi:putative SOS response-associated peptidase YedK
MDTQLRYRHNRAQRAVRGSAQSDAVVLGPEAWRAWLGEEVADPWHLKALLAPFPSEAMTCWPVSARVGNVKNNDPSLIEPLAAE